jgi:outer membrane protein assembly factor BamB
MGPHGEILLYNINLGTQPAQTTGYMEVWNASNLPGLYSSRVYNSMGWGQWKAMGRFLNATEVPNVTFGGQRYYPEVMPYNVSGYQWNVTIPKGLPGSVQRVWAGDRVVGASLSLTAVRMWAINLNKSKGAIGQVLYNNTWNAPAEWAAGNVSIAGFGGGWMCWSQTDKVGVLWIKETREHYAFSTEDGNYMWGPTEPQYYLDSIDDSSSDVRNIAYGKLYSASVGGVVYCYDVKTGERLWSYEASDPYTEILWSNNWWLKPVAIADGKIYVGHTEHSANQPFPRGAPFICLNATTGEEIWRINGAFRQTRWGGRGIIGDSIIATMDTYDQRVYAIGKGPSATSVSIQSDVITHGGSVMVKGTVTDTSPGTKASGLLLRFPNGVPAVADENMSDWMLYVYKQFERPANTVGVEVVISVLDPNNNYYEVGRTTSDADGFFKLAFTPEVPGEYTVIASFAGSKAYYGSYAKTAVNVEEAPATTPPPTPTPAPMTDTYVLGIGAGAIIAIVVVGLVIILLIRKRQ